MFKASLASVFWLLACGFTPQPDSLRYEVAIEIPLGPADRSDLLAMLRRHAAAGGLHVDDNSDAVMRLDAQLPPDAQLPAELRRTIYVGVFRGTEDDELEVSVNDTGVVGRAWIIFSRGAQPEAAARTRAALLGDINRRWPGARSVPVLPSGGLPSPADLRFTTSGYRIARSTAASYQLPTDSPLLEPR